MLIFHVERDARAWQSGLYYGNGRPKTSLPVVRAAALAAQTGTLAACDQSKTTANVDDVAFGGPSTTDPAVLQTGFTCNLPCTYELRILDAKTGDPVASASGKAVGLTTVKIPTAALAPGQYEYALRAPSAKPGTAETRSAPRSLRLRRCEGAHQLPTLEPVASHDASSSARLQSLPSWPCRHRQRRRRARCSIRSSTPYSLSTSYSPGRIATLRVTSLVSNLDLQILRAGGARVVERRAPGGRSSTSVSARGRELGRVRRGDVDQRAVLCAP